jgi:hypothetical protein
MVAVRVTNDVEMARGEIVLEQGVSFTVRDGHLEVASVQGDVIAVFAPGQWLAAKVDNRFA